MISIGPAILVLFRERDLRYYLLCFYIPKLNGRNLTCFQFSITLIYARKKQRYEWAKLIMDSLDANLETYTKPFQILDYLYYNFKNIYKLMPRRKIFLLLWNSQLINFCVILYINILIHQKKNLSFIIFLVLLSLFSAISQLHYSLANFRIYYIYNLLLYNFIFSPCLVIQKNLKNKRFLVLSVFFRNVFRNFSELAPIWQWATRCWRRVAHVKRCEAAKWATRGQQICSCCCRCCCCRPNQKPVSDFTASRSRSRCRSRSRNRSRSHSRSRRRSRSPPSPSHHWHRLEN